MRREPLHIGSVVWGTRNDLALKNGTTLPTWYEHNPVVSEQTNLGEFCQDVSPELDQSLDGAIAVVDRDLLASPGHTHDEARTLYERFRLDMGLMLFGLVCNSVPVERLKKVLGERFFPMEEQILRPYRPTLIGREARAIFAAQIESDRKPVEWFTETAERLAAEFGFIHSEYVSESWGAADYEAALRGERLEVIDALTLDRASFDEYEWWLISVVQRLSYLHDEGKSALVRTNWALRQTLKNLGMDDSMLHLSEVEFLEWTRSGTLPSKEEFRNRDTHFAIISQGDEHRFLFGKDAVESFVREQGLEEVAADQSIDAIRGSIASKGMVRGPVRIVLTQEDSKALREGEVLVASMTTPAYIDSMRRAVAYVTDEGGTICHAAIVAREFRKPCIVGTRMATRILRNGDLVEVDADHGVVRILERK